MAEVSLMINGKSYGISCDDGQEERVIELASYVDDRMRQMAGAGAASNEPHLMVLTSLMLADEIYELKQSKAQNQQNVTASQEASDTAVAEAITNLAMRIDNVANRIQKA